MSKLHNFTGLIVFLGCGLLACSSTESGTNKPGISRADASVVAAWPENEQPDAGQAGHSEGAVPETAAGTFSHIYEQAFKTCRTQCHVMGFSMLNMATRDAAYASLVDQTSNPGNKDCAMLGLKRVKPGAPDESLLYLKLDSHAPCGQQMPPGGQLRQELRDEVRDWIANGAQDD